MPSKSNSYSVKAPSAAWRWPRKNAKAPGPAIKQVKPAPFWPLGTNFLRQGFGEIKGVPAAGD